MLTFSRNTLPTVTQPVPREPFVFTEFSGEAGCFPTERQLVSEMGAAGFVRDAAVPLTEYNRPRPGSLQRFSGPLIYETTFRRDDGG